MKYIFHKNKCINCGIAPTGIWKRLPGGLFFEIKCPGCRTWTWRWCRCLTKRCRNNTKAGAVRDWNHANDPDSKLRLENGRTYGPSWEEFRRTKSRQEARSGASCNER